MNFFCHLSNILLMLLISSSTCQKIEKLYTVGDISKLTEGENVTLNCIGSGDELLWQHKRRNINSNSTERFVETVKAAEGKLQSKLTLLNVDLKDNGRYVCILKSKDEEVMKNISLRVQVNPKIVEAKNFTGGIGSEAKLYCRGKGVPITDVKWFKNSKDITANSRYSIDSKVKSFHHESVLAVPDISMMDNGTYICQFHNSLGTASESVLLLVQDVPIVALLAAISMGPEELALEWNIIPNNSPITKLEIVILYDASHEIIIDVPHALSSILLEKKDFEEFPDSQIPKHFLVSLRAFNDIGSSTSDIRNVTMLREKPNFIPEVILRGSTKDSLSVSWSRPNEELRSYIDFFRLSLLDSSSNVVFTTKESVDSSAFLFENLKDGTVYKFYIETCMKMVEKCGSPSETVSGRTLSEPPNGVSDVIVRCLNENDGSGRNRVYVKWEPPKDDSTVDRYKIELKASAHYINVLGRLDYFDNVTWKVVDSQLRNFTFENVEPNTNYSVKVYAGSGNVFSNSLMSNCETPIWVPHVNNQRWWKSKIGKRIVLKMPTPRISQRNGTICCHRIIVVQLMGNETVEDLPSPQDIPIIPPSTDSSPFSSSMGGYVAEAFLGHQVTKKYLLIGDGKATGDWLAQCAACLGVEFKSADNEVTDKTASALPYSSLLRNERSSMAPLFASDRYLSQDDNYTGFLLINVRNKNGTVMSSYSDYFNVIRPIEDSGHQSSSSTFSNLSNSLTNVVYILGILIVILVLMSVFLGFLICHFHRKRKRLLEDGSDESLSGSLGRIFRTLKRSHTLMSQPGLDVPAIPKDQLVSEYLEKIKDSELGFRKEFEALPEKFYDRSTRASEMSENSSKNRYPDIRAYDQTRVKLTQIDSVNGSDYINANYVLGYKERKKFICSQGPTESTVNDFWRMIVEQRSSMCIMLTNLEENGKVKCVKYWPEAGEPKTFGSITVRLVKEKVYSDYLVRTLRAEWTVPAVTATKPNLATEATPPQNSNTCENGVMKKGTEISKSNGSICNSTYNSLSSASLSHSSGEETKCHEVQQYHYLMWKDFVAPEHPVGLLSFLRRINEAYSPDLGPLLVHCSAGVGRTGSLVALDTLLLELEEEGQASIYNVICDLRHQRNFLVQSLKQYVFVHRALMEYAQFGVTELTISKLKENYSAHIQRNNSDVSSSSELNLEFERLSRVIEDRKAFTVAHSDTNKAKNRYDFVLPYDTNCVILMPLPSQIGATYINASFVSGFDMGENFIVTQDPLENTVSDFWRMIYEQSVNTIVMLSELGSGENHCATYWPEDEVMHEYVKVKFIKGESYPKYTTRSFQVTNTKSGDTNTVTQFQYVGWSGNLGEVPLVTYGIMEVITRVHSHVESNQCKLSDISSYSPTVVHCSGGGDRSSVYVCLNNCLRQLRRESRVDIFQIARKIRSQRQFQIQEFSQYEFIYKALVEYIDMKRGENL